MSGGVGEWIDLSRSDDPRDVAHRVVASLARGGVVGLASETVYGLVASALNPAGVARLRALRDADDVRPLTLLVKGVEEAADWAPDASEVAARLARRSWPGPLTLILPRSSGGGLFDRLPAESRSAIAPAGDIALRGPAEPFLREILRYCPAPLVVGPIRAADGSPATTADPMRDLADVDVAIDSGPTRLGRVATAVRVEGDRWTIVREGAIDAATLAMRAGRILAFVCTGNTCRSPMAEGICKLLLARRLGCSPDDLERRGYAVVSAGVSASRGAPAAAHAAEILRSMGGSLDRHRSRPVGPDLVRHADRLFAMTADHLELLLDIAPEAGSIASLLDPEGRDVPDPFGSDLPTYRRTADAIERMLARRLNELGIPEPPPAA